MNKTLPLLASVALGLAVALAVATPTRAQTPVPPTGKVTVAGQIVNGTAGGTVPISITLMLHAYDGNATSQMLHSEADSAGKFRFENLDTAQGRTFEVMAGVGSATYYSPLLDAKSGQAILDAPITIYDTTTDASRVRIERLNASIEFLNEKWVRVSEWYILSNEGDRTVEGAVKTDDGKPAALRFSLPVGARGLQFEGDPSGQRFLQTSDGFVDTWALPPGKDSSQVVASYILPYEGNARVERTLNYATSGVNVTLADDSVKLASTQLRAQGARQAKDGTTVLVFSRGELTAGQLLSFDLSGQPKVARLAPKNKPPADGNSRGLLIGGLVLGLALIAGGLVWLRATMRPRPVQVKPDFETQRNALIQAMADLDDDFEAGVVTEAERDRQRSLLRAELIALLEQQRPTSTKP